MRAIQSLALGKMTQRILMKEPKTKDIGTAYRGEGGCWENVKLLWDW